MPYTPDWMLASFPIIRIVFISLIAILAIAIVVCIFLQPAAADGAGVITGQSQDTYYSKNKEQTFEGLMKRVTVGLSIAVAVISILFFVSIRLVPIGMGAF